MKCKLTDKDMKPFISFSKMPLTNGFLDKDEFKSEYFFEMEVGFSEDLFHFHHNLPDLAYLVAWNHREKIFAKEKDFIKKDEQWISHVFI